MHVTPTVLGNTIQAAQYLGLPHTVNEVTTLNTLHEVAKDLKPEPDEMPTVAYLAVGNAGHTHVKGADNISRIKHIHHSPRHTGLYNQVPFVLRPIENDLTEEEQKKYRLRVKQTYNGKEYMAYYLRVLDLTGVKVVPEIKHVTNGNVTSEPFKFVADDLKPDAVDYANNTVITADGDYVSVSAKVKITLSEEDINEFIDAAVIIYGDESYAMISELALVTGVDRLIPNTTGVGGANITEVIAAQISCFLNRFYLMEQNTTGVELILDVGDEQPLML